MVQADLNVSNASIEMVRGVYALSQGGNLTSRNKSCGRVESVQMGSTSGGNQHMCGAIMLRAARTLIPGGLKGYSEGKRSTP